MALIFDTGSETLNQRLRALTPSVHAACEGADSAHDLAHVERVTRNAQRLSRATGARTEISVTAALLHELFNYPKGHPDSRNSGHVCAQHASALLTQHAWDQETITQVHYAIAVHPFSLGVVPTTLEAQVLQDADRLDAIGAIGIARCFATCAAMGRPFYDPDDPWSEHRALDDKLWGVDHFALKLDKLAGSMHTEAAREMAHAKSAFMSEFLAQMRAEVG
ncbi:MAG: HD domain-containing protein [Deltaproteobacteria bacterium]|nr:HD domain-containing protein [Deltaproteobacteria bacterium]